MAQCPVLPPDTRAHLPGRGTGPSFTAAGCVCPCEPAPVPQLPVREVSRFTETLRLCLFSPPHGHRPQLPLLHQVRSPALLARAAAWRPLASLELPLASGGVARGGVGGWSGRCHPPPEATPRPTCAIEKQNRPFSWSVASTELSLKQLEYCYLSSSFFLLFKCTRM